MKTLYTIEYDLHALHEKIKNNERKKQVAISKLQCFKADLSEQQQSLVQLEQGRLHLVALLKTEEDSLKSDQIDPNSMQEERQYLDEIRSLIAKTAQQQEQVNAKIDDIRQHTEQQHALILERQQKTKQYKQKKIELNQQENNNVDIKSILQAEVLAPVYKTVEIFSSIKELGAAFSTFYKQKSAQGQKPIFMMAVSGFSLLLLGFVYLLLHMLSQLSFGWWIFLGAFISCAFVLLGLWLKKTKDGAGVLASLFIFFGFTVIYSGVWILSFNFEMVTPWILHIILLLLNGLTFPFIHMFRMKSLLLLTLPLSLIISAYSGGSDQIITQLSYLWALSAVTLYMLHRLQWYLSIYIVFFMGISALIYLLLPIAATVTAMGNLSYLMFVQSFFMLYLVVLLSCSNSSQSRLAEFFLLLNFILFMTLVYVQADKQLLAYIFMGNAIALFLGGIVLHYWFIRDMQSIIIWMMAALLWSVSIYFIGGIYSPILWGLEALFFLLLGFVLNMRVIRQAAYLGILSTFIITLYMISTMIWGENGVVLDFSTPWFYFIFIGVFAQVVLILLKWFNSVLNPREKALAYYLREDLSIWLSVVILYAAAILTPSHWLIAALPLSLLLLNRALRMRLIMTEVLALFLSSVVLWQLLMAFYDQGKVMFLSLDWTARCAWLGVFLLLWFIPWLYRFYTVQGQRILMAPWMQTAFYILLPICWLPDVWFLAQDWFAAALWAAALLAFVLYKWRKSKIHYIENLILTVVAALISMLSLSSWGITLSTPHQQLSLFSGIVYFMLLFVGVKGEVLRNEHHRYHYVMISGLYFSVFSVLAFAYLYLLSDIWLLGLLLFQLFTFLIAWKAPAYRLLHGQFPFCYIVCVLLPLPVIYLIFTEPVSLMGSLLMLASVGMATLLIHFRYGHFNKIWDEYRLYDMLLILAHIWIILTYCALAYQWQLAHLQMALTVCLLLHTTLMFLLATMGSHYKLLFQVSLGSCALIAVKVIFYDLKSDSMFEKVVVLLIFGSLLVLGAYFMQRISQRRIEAE